MRRADGQAGFCGKLPSRGDHLALGLPRGFTDPWNAWLDATLPAVRAALGEAWREAWMEAPIWHFALPGGQCGAAAALGVWMPSVDRVGRLFPLTLAWVGACADLPGDDAAWRAAAEQAGLAALGSDMSPEELAARLDAAPAPGGAARPAAAARWWTEGAPRVPPASLDLDRLPPPDRFAGMLLDPSLLHGVRETTP